jgi:hypothetical protein
VLKPWRSWNGEPVPVPVAAPVSRDVDANALSVERFCPRCNTRTRWSNEHDHTPTIACDQCGLTVTSALTPEEQERAARFEAKRIIPKRRRYVAC